MKVVTDFIVTDRHLTIRYDCNGSLTGGIRNSYFRRTRVKLGMDGTSSRRRFLLSGLAAAVGLAGCGQTPPETTETDTAESSETTTSPGTRTGTTSNPTPPDAVGLETLASGLTAPVAVAFPTDADYWYVADQEGRIYAYESGALRDRPFLDLRDTVEFGGEKGLLGIALHPDFASNRRLYVRYSAPRRPGTPSNYSHTFVLAEFEAIADGRGVKRDSERAVVEIPEPQSNHNAGAIAFGPDGYLYVAVGDGGAGGDQGAGHVTDWYDGVDGGNGQDVTENLLGSILRIDVDGRADGKGYAVPDDNPLVGRDGLDEHFAWGFRNPWRVSFDDGDLLVGDVGQNEYEEVDLVTKGGNYGWNVKEATHCYGADDCPSETPERVRGGEPLVDPVIEYPHSGDAVSGISVIGGYVYRGSTLPGLRGTYLFGDLRVGGRLFAATPRTNGKPWPTRVIDIAGDDSDKLDQLLSFGRDGSGEVYVLGIGADGGGVYRISPTS